MKQIELFLSDPRYIALDDASKKEALDRYFNKYVPQDSRYQALDEAGKKATYQKFMDKYYAPPQHPAPQPQPKQRSLREMMSPEALGTPSLGVQPEPADNTNVAAVENFMADKYREDAQMGYERGQKAVAKEGKPKNIWQEMDAGFTAGLSSLVYAPAAIDALIHGDKYSANYIQGAIDERLSQAGFDDMDMGKAITEGKIKKAAGMALKTFAQSAPTTLLWLATSSLFPGSTILADEAIATSTGASKYTQLDREMPELSTGRKLASAANAGFWEAASEEIGNRIAFLNKYVKTGSKMGKAAISSLIKKEIGKTTLFKAGMGVGLGALGEGGEELLNFNGEYWGDVLLGITENDPKAYITGSVNSTLLGMSAGGIQGGMTATYSNLVNARYTNLQSKLEKAADIDLTKITDKDKWNAAKNLKQLAQNTQTAIEFAQGGDTEAALQLAKENLGAAQRIVSKEGSSAISSVGMYNALLVDTLTEYGNKEEGANALKNVVSDNVMEAIKQQEPQVHPSQPAQADYATIQSLVDKAMESKAQTDIDAANAAVQSAINSGDRSEDIQVLQTAIRTVKVQKSKPKAIKPAEPAKEIKPEVKAVKPVAEVKAEETAEVGEAEFPDAKQIEKLEGLSARAGRALENDPYNIKAAAKKAEALAKLAIYDASRIKDAEGELKYATNVYEDTYAPYEETKNTGKAELDAARKALAATKKAIAGNGGKSFPMPSAKKVENPVQPEPTPKPKAEAKSYTEDNLRTMGFDQIENYKETVGVGKYKGKTWRTAEYEATNAQGETRKYTVKVSSDGVTTVKDNGKTKRQIEKEDVAEYEKHPQVIRDWLNIHLGSTNTYLKNKIAQFMDGTGKDYAALKTVFTEAELKRHGWEGVKTLSEIEGKLKDIARLLLSPAPQPAAKPKTKIKPAYVMTLAEYTKQYVDNHAYKDKYEQAKILNILEKQAQDEWIKSLKEQAQKGRLSDKSIDSYVHAFGAGSLQSVFRGVYAKGIEGWIPADIRNAPKESAKERLQERLNKLERQLLEPDYKVSSKEKAKIRAKIKGIIKALQATEGKVVEKPAAETKITDRQSFQEQWREAQKGKLTDEQIDAQLEIVDAIMNTFAKEMDMTLDETYAIVEQIGTEELKDALNQVDAYHGSGAFFDRFDVKFVGTGEGAQAFGWGIYVSERKGVAKSYADGVGKDTAILKRNGVQSKPEEIAMEIVNQTIPDNAISDKSRQYVLDVITEILSETNKARVKALTETQLILVPQRIKEWENWQDLYRRISESEVKRAKDIVKDYQARILAYEKLKEIIPELTITKIVGSHALYTVSVWDDRTEDVLEWYKPATPDQVDKINKQLEKEGIEYRIKQDPDTGKWAFARETADGIRWRAHAKTGQELYNYLSAELGGDKKASEFLLRAGIDGIKYPVQAMSGGKGEKGYNYVVFDADAINIREHTLYQDIAAQVKFRADGKIELAFIQPDITSGLHEMAHIGRRMIAVMAQKSPKWQTLQKAAEEWSGAKNGEWSTEAEEKFANGFLKYLHEGTAPSPKLKTVFEKIKQWFSEAINRLRDFAGLTLNQDIIGVYDALLGKPVKEIAQQSQQEKAEKTLEKLIEKNLVSAGHGDIWLGEDADIGAISQVAPDTFVRVKDTNGYRASFTISEFKELSKNTNFTDRIREARLEFSYREPTGEMFMDIPLGKSFISTLTAPPNGGTVRVIKGVKVVENAQVPNIKYEAFVKALNDDVLRELLVAFGVKEVHIDPPYQFSLTEEGNVSVKDGIIRLNADANNPLQTLQHEVAHMIWDAIPEMQKQKIRDVIISDDIAADGYMKDFQRRGEIAGYDPFQEAFAEYLLSNEKLQELVVDIVEERVANGNPNLTPKQKVAAVKVAEQQKSKIINDPLKLEKELDNLANKTGLVLDARKTGSRISYSLINVDDGSTLVEVHHKDGEYNINGFYADNNADAMSKIGELLESNNVVLNQMSSADIAEAERQMAAVRKKYEGTEQWMKAPNGKPTKLNERQWLQVRTQNFKDWFGNWDIPNNRGSKILDENGEPLIVYHGTGTTINEFKYEYTNQGNDQYNSGFYLTNDYDTALGYTNATLKDKEKLGGNDNPNVVEAFLAIKKPIRINGTATSNLMDVKLPSSVVYELMRYAPNIRNAQGNPKGYSVLGDWFSEYWDIQGNEKGEIPTSQFYYLLRRLINDIGKENLTLGTIERDFYDDDILLYHERIKTLTGHDGVEIEFDNGVKHYVAWFNTQIKSATANVGTFSSATAVILDQAVASASPEAQERIAKIKQAAQNAQARARATYRNLRTKMNTTTTVSNWETLMRKALITSIKNSFPGTAPLNVARYEALKEQLSELDPGIEEEAKEITRIKRKLRQMIRNDERFRDALQEVSGGYEDVAYIPFEQLFNALSNTNPAAYDMFMNDEAMTVLLKVLPRIKEGIGQEYNDKTLQMIVNSFMTDSNPYWGVADWTTAFLQPQRYLTTIFGKAGAKVIDLAYQGTLANSAYEHEYEPYLNDLHRLLMTNKNNRGSAYIGGEIDIIGRTIFEVDGDRSITDKLPTIQQRLADWSKTHSVINPKDVAEIYAAKEAIKETVKDFIIEWNADPAHTHKIGIRDDYDNPRNYKWGGISEITTKFTRYLFTPANAKKRAAEDLAANLDYNTNIFEAYRNYAYAMTKYMAFADLANYVEDSTMIIPIKDKETGGSKIMRKKMGSQFDLDLSMAQRHAATSAREYLSNYVRDAIGYHKHNSPGDRILSAARSNLYTSTLALNMIMTVLNYNQRNLIYTSVDPKIAWQVKDDFNFWSGLFKDTGGKYPTLAGVMQKYVIANQSLLAELSAEVRQNAEMGETKISKAYYSATAKYNELLKRSVFSLAELGNRAWAHAAGVYQVVQNSQAFKDNVKAGMDVHEAMDKALAADPALRRAAITYGGIINAEMNADANPAFAPAMFREHAKMNKVAAFMRYGTTITLLELRTYGGAKDLKSALSPDLFNLIMSGNVQAATAAQTIQAAQIMKSWTSPARVAKLIKDGKVSKTNNPNMLSANQVGIVHEAVSWALDEYAKSTEKDFADIVRGKQGARKKMAAIFAFSLSEMLLRFVMELMLSLIPWWQGKKQFTDTDVIYNISTILGLSQTTKTLANYRLGVGLIPDLNYYNKSNKQVLKSISQFVLRLTPFAGSANYAGKLFMGKYYSDQFWDKVYE